jgi:hypothetical protein
MLQRATGSSACSVAKKSRYRAAAREHGIASGRWRVVAPWHHAIDSDLPEGSARRCTGVLRVASTRRTPKTGVYTLSEGAKMGAVVPRPWRLPTPGPLPGRS